MITQPKMTRSRLCVAALVLSLPSSVISVRSAIAVVGRPNVGKSTIVNRLTQKFGTSGAVVYDEPGVTRDRTYGKGFWGAHEFSVIDTGGLVFDDDPNQVFMPHIRQQALAALTEARVALLVVDGKDGCSPLDEDIAAFLRKQGVPTVLAVNKCESTTQGEVQAADFWGLGLGEPWAVSGLHGTGMGEVMDELVKHLPPAGPIAEEEEAETDLRVAILGRPNVGKSSLLNRLTASDRAIVSPVAGTTRDAIDQTVKRQGRSYTFIDTAGVRRSARVGKGTEEEMVRRALKAGRRSDVCLLVVDATEGVSEQEVRLARFVAEAGRACVVLVNKWDTVGEKDDRMYKWSRELLQTKLRSVAWATPLFVSAETGLNAHKVFEAIEKAAEQHRRRISTSVMNEVLEDAVRWQKPPSTTTGRQGSVYYCAQVATRPPTTVVFCNDPELFGDSYRRYLEKHVRAALGFQGTPIRLVFRARSRRDT